MGWAGGAMQCKGILQIWIIVQGPTAFAVGVDGVVWIVFSFVCLFALLSPSLRVGRLVVLGFTIR